jgi:hypothetical protein
VAPEPLNTFPTVNAGWYDPRFPDREDVMAKPPASAMLIVNAPVIDTASHLTETWLHLPRSGPVLDVIEVFDDDSTSCPVDPVIPNQKTWFIDAMVKSWLRLDVMSGFTHDSMVNEDVMCSEDLTGGLNWTI